MKKTEEYRRMVEGDLFADEDFGYKEMEDEAHKGGKHVKQDVHSPISLS